MPKVVMISTAADADRVLHSGQTVVVSKEDAKELIESGAARALTASEDEAAAPVERATGRRGASKAVSGPSEAK